MTKTREEVTLPSTPLAKIVGPVLKAEMASFREEMELRLTAFEGRVCEALVNELAPTFRAELAAESEARRADTRDLRERLSLVEQHLGLDRHRDTMPAPSLPPMGGE